MRDDMSLSVQLKELDKTIDRRKTYVQLRKAKADSVYTLIQNAPSVKEKLPLMVEYCDLYRGLSSDSMINISNRGLKMSMEIADSFYVQTFYTTRAHGYFNRGQAHDGIVDLNHIAEAGVYPGVEKRYHYVSYIIYFTIGALYNEDGGQRTDYLKLGREHIRAMQKLTSPDDPHHTFFEGMLNMIDEKTRLMETNFHKVLEMTDEHDPANSLSHTFLGYLCLESSNLSHAAEHLATSSRLNIIDANQHEVAILLLGETLFKMGETMRASNYLSTAIESAIESDMKFNLMRMNNVLIDVAKALDSERRQSKIQIYVIIVILVIMLLIVGVLMHGKRREVKHLRKVEARLDRTNKAKDTYIEEFMNLCSSYIESLEEYNTMSKRKIAAGQTEELLAFMKSDKIIEEQRDKFYKVFDTAFFDLFPTYVDDVNNLLQPGKRIVAPQGSLTTELRILAMSRLGIEDSQAVSRFLGISTNTIYTYRNKLRTRAANRNTFEEDAKQIGTV